MALPRRPIVAVLACLLFLAGCGTDADETARGTPGTRAVATAPSELASLVPADAVGVLYAPSIDGLNKRLNALIREFQVREFQASVPLDVAELLTRVVGPDVASRVDKSRPIAIALSLVARPSAGGDGAPEPVPTFVVPVKSSAPAKAADGKGGPATVPLGSYVGVSHVPGYAVQATAAPILAGLPGGDVAVRLEIAKAVDRVRPQLEALLGGAKPLGEDEAARPGDPAGALSNAFGQIGAAVRDFLESAERLDLALWADGGKVDLEVTFTAKEASKLATTLASGEDATPLAAVLPREFPLEALMAVRMDEVMKLLTPLMKQATARLGPEAQEAFERQQALTAEAYALLGGATALGMGFGKAGLEGAMVARVKDPKAYREKSEALYASYGAGPDVGVRFTALPASKVAGVDVRGWRIELDVERLMSLGGERPASPLPFDLEAMTQAVLGKEGLRMREALVGDLAVVVYGDDDAMLEKAIAAAKGGGKAPPGLAAALARGPGKPALVVRFELREFLTQVMDVVRTTSPTLAKDIPVVPSGAPVPIVVRATTEGRTFRGGLSVDVAGVAELVRAMTQSAGPR